MQPLVPELERKWAERIARNVASKIGRSPATVGLSHAAWEERCHLAMVAISETITVIETK